MAEQEIIARYEREQPIYEAWGKHVQSSIYDELSKIRSCELFLKIHTPPRVKNINSLIAKALLRGKPYTNPYEEITDKVGVRFVVLTSDDIELVKNIIQNFGSWVFSEDRDYEKEKREKPEFFTYQSVHHVVRNKEDIQKDGVLIPKGTPCEVQIRTLLQHSYAELSRDTVYKQEKYITPEIRRMTARSMALIEATDVTFEEARRLVDKYDNIFYSFVKIFDDPQKNEYYVEALNRFIFDAYRAVIEANNVSSSDVKAFVEEKDFLFTVHKNDKDLLYKQPILYLVYYLIEQYKHQAWQFWPLTEAELRPLFNDLGKSTENF